MSNLGDWFQDQGISEGFFGGSEDAEYIGQAPTMTSAQQQFLNQLVNTMAGELDQGVTPYQGELAAGSSPLQQMTYDQLSNFMGGDYDPSQFAGTGMQSAMDMINKAVGQKTNVMGPTQVDRVDLGEFDPSASQQWWKDSAMAPAMQSWKEEILPGIKEEFISQNAGSSSAADRAIAKSGSDMMTGLNAILADKISQERGDHTGRQFQADINAANQKFGAGESFADRSLSGSGMDISNLFQGAGQMGGLGSDSFNQFMQSLGVGGSLGSQEQQTMNAILQGDYTNWLSGQDYNNPWLNLIGPTLGSQAFEPIVQGPTSQSGLLQMIAGPTMQGWSSTWGS